VADADPEPTTVTSVPWGVLVAPPSVDSSSCTVAVVPVSARATQRSVYGCPAVTGRQAAVNDCVPLATSADAMNPIVEPAASVDGVTANAWKEAVCGSTVHRGSMTCRFHVEIEPSAVPAASAHRSSPDSDAGSGPVESRFGLAPAVSPSR
jgi:predicted GNAT family acetyltransferase